MLPNRKGEATVDQAGEQRSARVESLRALAALAVLVSHIAIGSLAAQAADAPHAGANPFEQLLVGGNLGVFLFFTLTGFLLFRPFARAAFAGGRPVALGNYARNRALRILPLYFTVVLVFFLLAGSAPGEPGLLRYLTLTQYLEPGALPGPDALGPLWSVVVELQFYVLLPALAVGLAALAGASLRRAALIVAAAGGASLLLWVIQVGGSHLGLAEPFWRLNLPANFVFFVPGMLLALLAIGAERDGRLSVPDRLGSSALWVAASVPFALIPIWVGYELTPLICIASFLLVGGCVLPLRRARATRVLGWQPLALLGVASYSLYAWHNPLLELLRDSGLSFADLAAVAAIAIPAAIATAAVSYFVIEAPFLRLRRAWFGRRPAPSRADPAAVAAPLHGSQGQAEPAPARSL